MAYKTMFTENYYRDMWDRLVEKYTKNDPEKDLEITMKAYRDLDLPESAKEVILQIEAKKVYDFISDTLKGTLRTLNAILSGKASLGYTTERQEIQARHEIREGFEFDCLRLADFKKKYNL
jgi:hypothetical protein